ncbi:MAG: twin-arginine translocase TatA/TatE family subunit [Candidatus Eremiobacteraeota bacterium]|nr:twin-arginine translocase TatA/TatE family subunit [Candidatus Eremiobacteraeota bacterium]
MLLAMFGNPMEIALLVGAAIILFGGNKIRDVARGLGAAKKEFIVGQAEAEAAAEHARVEARINAERAAVGASAAGTGVGGAVSEPPPVTPPPSSPAAP